MGQTATAEVARQTIEQGSVVMLYRPRVQEQDPHGLGDVQRLLILLRPAGAAFERLIVVGRKRLPRSARRDRFWGFVDLVLTPSDMTAALDAQVYGTKTRGLRHLPAARPFASGTYELGTHHDHTHLRWSVQRIASSDPIAFDVDVESDADYQITVANPDPAAWGVAELPDLQTALFDELELHVTIPAPFPPLLQQRLGDRRFGHVDAPGWLDHPGAEVVFAGSND